LQRGLSAIAELLVMLVMIKALLYERTVALRASMDFGKGWEDLSLDVTAVT